MKKKKIFLILLSISLLITNANSSLRCKTSTGYGELEQKDIIPNDFFKRQLLKKDCVIMHAPTSTNSMPVARLMYKSGLLGVKSVDLKWFGQCGRVFGMRMCARIAMPGSYGNRTHQTNQPRNQLCVYYDTMDINDNDPDFMPLHQKTINPYIVKGVNNVSDLDIIPFLEQFEFDYKNFGGSFSRFKNRYRALGEQVNRVVLNNDLGCIDLPGPKNPPLFSHSGRLPIRKFDVKRVCTIEEMLDRDITNCEHNCSDQIIDKLISETKENLRSDSSFMTNLTGCTNNYHEPKTYFSEDILTPDCNLVVNGSVFEGRCVEFENSNSAKYSLAAEVPNCTNTKGEFCYNLYDYKMSSEGLMAKTNIQDQRKSLRLVRSYVAFNSNGRKVVVNKDTPSSQTQQTTYEVIGVNENNNYILSLIPTPIEFYTAGNSPVVGPFRANMVTNVPLYPNGSSSLRDVRATIDPTITGDNTASKICVIYGDDAPKILGCTDREAISEDEISVKRDDRLCPKALRIDFYKLNNYVCLSPETINSFSYYATIFNLENFGIE